MDAEAELFAFGYCALLKLNFYPKYALSNAAAALSVNSYQAKLVVKK